MSKWLVYLLKLDALRPLSRESMMQGLSCARVDVDVSQSGICFFNIFTRFTTSKADLKEAQRLRHWQTLMIWQSPHAEGWYQGMIITTILSNVYCWQFCAHAVINPVTAPNSPFGPSPGSFGQSHSIAMKVMPWLVCFNFPCYPQDASYFSQFGRRSAWEDQDSNSFE